VAEQEKEILTEPDTEVNEAAEENAGEVLEDTEETKKFEADETEDEAAEGADASDEEDDAEKKDAKKDAKIFKKKAKADKKSEAMKEKIDELEDRVKRQMAEFENFRKRTDKEKSAMFETGAKSVIEKILPIVDNFERGFQGMSEADLEEPFAKGMKMVYDQLMTELDNLGVKPIEAVGKEFDPDLHNAVMQVESDEYEEGIIAQELLKGYTYRDSVVRHSMVAVTQ